MNRPPLPSEIGYWRSGEDRQQFVNALFDGSAEHYDCACSIMSVGSGQRYRHDALKRAGLRPGMRVLDVGTGTGLLAREIGNILGSTVGIVGLDPSWRMMVAGRRQSNIRLVQGVGERLPFPDRHFDFVTMGYALRHVADLDEAFEEYHRVLKPGGKVLLLEITRPTTVAGYAMARLYFGTLVPFATRIRTGSPMAAELMRFYWATIAQCVPPETVLASLASVGFQPPKRTIVYGIFSEYTAARTT